MVDMALPAAIAELIAATNDGDSERFVSSFTADARVEDGGRVFLGSDGVAQWNATDNVGVGMRFALLSSREIASETYDVTVRATSRRFNGTGAMHVTLRDGLIAALVVG